MALSRTLEISGAPPIAFSPAGLPWRPRGKKADSIRIPSPQINIGVTNVSNSVSQVGPNLSQSFRLVRLSLEVVGKGGSSAKLMDIPFKVSTSGSNEIILTSEEGQTPWNFLVSVGSQRKQMSVSFKLNYAGLDIDQALQGLSFYSALASGGTLYIRGRHPVTGSDLDLASARIPAGSYPKPDVRLLGTLQQLAFIEMKTGVSFLVPRDDITSDVANTIAATARILETGRAEYEAQPWTSISPVEQAKAALEAFANGRPAPMAIHFDNQVVSIFDTDVMLGPVTLFCDRTYITTEDIAELREQLRNVKKQGTVRIRLTPFENCSIEARYVNWLPEDEAEAIRQLPMYQKDEAIHSEDRWALPAVDVANAILLLESWYGEDADEQKASWKLLKTALERDRLSNRKLFS